MKNLKKRINQLVQFFLPYLKKQTYFFTQFSMYRNFCQNLIFSPSKIYSKKFYLNIFYRKATDNVLSLIYEGRLLKI